MKQTLKKCCLLIAGFIFLAPLGLLAQKEDNEKTEKEKVRKDVQQIIITRTGDNDDKVVVEIKGDKITINGKPLDDYKDKDGDLKVRLQKFKEMDGLSWNPRTGGNFNGNNDHFNIITENSNTAMLGVSTEKDDQGVKVNDITDESAAEKIGIKEGDVITKIDDTKIEDPDDLSAAIKKHKPGDKVNVAWLRDKKEMKAVAELTKWKGAAIFMNGNNFKMDLGDMNFDKMMPKVPNVPGMPRMPFSQNWSWSSGTPKLGLSIQDPDDGKGVKVIDVDGESNAEKAGIKEDDVITEVDGKTVNGTDEMVKAIRDSKEKISVMFKILRNGKTQNIEVKMPRRIKTADL